MTEMENEREKRKNRLTRHIHAMNRSVEIYLSMMRTTLLGVAALVVYRLVDEGTLGSLQPWKLEDWWDGAVCSYGVWFLWSGMFAIIDYWIAGFFITELEKEQEDS